MDFNASRQRLAATSLPLWKTAKQASQVKQTVSMEEVKKLQDLVHEVAHLFADSKAQ